jgi:lipopolysaccharide export system permease protein
MVTQLLTMFGFFALVLVSVYWVNRAVSLFDQLIGDGQSALVFVELSALTLPAVIRAVLPVAAFAATVFVTNRLATESELVVMQATGFSAFRLARPVLIFGVLVAALLAVLSHVLVPAARAQLADRQGQIAENITARFLTEGAFLHPADGITLYIREVTETGELREVFLSDGRRPGARTTYTAQRALIVRGDGGPKLVMLDGLAQSSREATGQLYVTRFADFTYDLGALIGQRASDRRDLREVPTADLIQPTPEFMELTRSTPAAVLTELHNRMVQPMLAPVAALLGFSALLLGGFSRFGLWRQILGAVVAIILVQLVNNAATGISLRDPRFWPVNYAPVALGGLAAAVMLWWAGRARRPRRVARDPGPAGAAA